MSLFSALQQETNIARALTKYQKEGLPPTAKICFADRVNGPDHVLYLAQERASDGFEIIDDVTGNVDLKEVGKAYKHLAVFHIKSVKSKAKETEGIWESRSTTNGVSCVGR